MEIPLALEISSKAFLCFLVIFLFFLRVATIHSIKNPPDWVYVVLAYSAGSGLVSLISVIITIPF